MCFPDKEQVHLFVGTYHWCIQNLEQADIKTCGGKCPMLGLLINLRAMALLTLLSLDSL